MIPMEIITALGGMVVTGALKLMAAKQEQQATLFKQAMARHQEGARERASIREIAGWFGVTRRIIALSVVGAVVVVPLIAPLFYPELVVYNCADTREAVNVLFGLFSSTSTEAMSCKATAGIAITPFHTHLVSLIAGMYFGSKVK